MQRGATVDEFSEAVANHHEDLGRFAYALCRDAARAEDIVAEAYARVWPRWRRGRVEQLLPYLRTTVVNEVYRRHRRLKLERREASRPGPQPTEGAFENGVDDRDALWHALGRLQLNQRVVVVLRVVEDLSEAQTAAMLGLPTGTVKSRLSRALAELRSMLEDHHG